MKLSWLGGAITWTVRRAADIAPQAICDRLAEEWLADLSARSSPMQRLSFALGCCWAALAMRGKRFAATLPKAADPNGTDRLVPLPTVACGPIATPEAALICGLKTAPAFILIVVFLIFLILSP